jgi:23S rRNA (cytosine1962-C5)-methyltransferase
MSQERHLSVRGFRGYELLDSGEHMKLERFGDLTLARPDTQAIWKQAKPELWESADATFAWKSGRGAWVKRDGLPEDWTVPYQDLAFKAAFGNFKHTGLFPEQEPNWRWSADAIKTLGAPEVLNLFGYTGAASVAAAAAGAQVTHVDSSKASLNWCRENAVRSGVAEDRIRLIHEDARKFAKREQKRGAKYHGIILDPPAFGRGSKDEVWKIEEDLLPLMETLAEILSPESGSFFLVNGYAAGYSPASFAQLTESVFPGTAVECGELRLPETGSERSIPEGIYARFVR